MDTDERKNLEALLQIHRRRLQALEEQQARFGVSTPVEITIEIDDIRAKIVELVPRLEKLETAAYIAQVEAAGNVNPAASVAPVTSSDPLARYEIGLRRLLEQLGKNHPSYPDALVFEQRLSENISRMRLYGDNEALRADRAQIIDLLNRLSLETLAISFNELCERERVSNQPTPRPPASGAKPHPPPAERNQIFISYSHSDAKWLKQLQTHLKPLERLGTITRWDDTMLEPGSNWREEIEKAIKAAKVAILLISARYLASDFIASEEIPPLLAAAEQEGAVILPIILSPCYFVQTESLSRFQAVNPPSQPLANMPGYRRDEVFVKVTETVAKVMRRLDDA